MKICIFVFVSLKPQSLAFEGYSSFVSLFVGFHRGDNGCGHGRARGSGIGGGGGVSVTGNFMKGTGSGSGWGSRCDGSGRGWW